MIVESVRLPDRTVTAMPFRLPLLMPLWFLATLCGLPHVVHAASPNVLLICIDDLRPELNCYGVEYIHSPNIDQLAHEGVLFQHHYVQAPTCGASRCALLTGKYGGAANDALFKRAEKLRAGDATIPLSMPAWFRQNGYQAVSVGKVSHHPGGRGGPDWDDSQIPEMPNSWDRHLLPAGPWQHPRGAMHGLAHGEIRVNVGEMDLFQSVAGEDSIYPDGLIVEEALRQLDDLTSETSPPFFLAVGIIRPHLPFGAPAKYMERYRSATLPVTLHPNKPVGTTTWHGSGEFMKYQRWKRDPNTDAEFAIEVRKHYAACVTFADAQVGKLIEKLKDRNAWDNTIVVLWGDHGWHLGEHAIWGKHALFEESLRSPLIVRYPGNERAGLTTDALVESIDLFPTLCELTGLPNPEFSDGTSLLPNLSGLPVKEHPAISYFKTARTIRTPTHRLIAHRDGFLELYDHTTNAGETENIAGRSPELAAQLLDQLNRRVPPR